MANDLTFAIKAINEATGVLKTVQGDIQGLGDTADKSSGHMGKFAGALGDVAKIAGGFVVAQGLMQLPGFLFDATQAAADDAESTARLGQTLRNLGGDFDAHMASVSQAIQRGQDLAFTDDDIRDSFNKLALATGDSDEAMKRLALAEDLARGAHIPLADASKLLGKITDDNLQVFKRMGITLSDVATETDVLNAVQAKFGGQAETYAKSAAGSWARFGIQMAEVKESVGYALLPVMASLGTVMTEQVAPAAQVAADKLGEVAAVSWDQMQAAWATIGPDVTEAAAATWDSLIALGSVSWGAMQGSWAVIGPAVTEAAGAIARFVSSLSGTDKMLIALGMLAPAFSAFILVARGLNAVGVDLGTITGALGAIVSAISPLVALWRPLIEEDFKAAVQAAKDVGSAFGPLASAFGELVTQLKPLQPLIEPAVKVLAVMTALPFAPLALAITAVLLAFKPTIEFIGNVAKKEIEIFTTSIDALNKAIDLFKESVGPKIVEVLKQVVKLAGDIVGAFAGAGTMLLSAGTKIVEGLWQGIENALPALMAKVRSKLDPRNWDIPGLSPFTEAYEHAGQIAGENLSVGVGGGILAGVGSATEAAIGAAAAISSAYQEQLARDLAAWESDFLQRAASEARRELGGAFNVGQMFGSSATEGNYNGALGAYPGMAGGGYWGTGSGYSGPNNLPRYLPSSVSYPNSGPQSPSSMTININAPVNGVDDLLKVLDTAARRMGYSGVLTP